MIALLQYAGGWSALPCRVVSFPAAVLVTWWLNYRFTFRTRGGWGELLRYLSTQGFGLLTNLAAYAAVIFAVPEFNHRALIPLAVGSGIGLAVNFLLAKHWVFRGAKL